MNSCPLPTRVKYLVSGFLTDKRGSAGIELVIWLLMLMVFLVLPFMLFLFEVNMHIHYAVASAGLVDNLLEQSDWHVATEALAEVEVSLSQQRLEEALRQAINEKLQTPDAALVLENLSVVVEADPTTSVARLELQATFSYVPVTFLGSLFSGERMALEVHRIREAPIDH